MTDAAQNTDLVDFRGEHMSVDQLLDVANNLRTELAKTKQENRKAAKSVKQDLASVMKLLKDKISGESGNNKKSPDIKYKKPDKRTGRGRD